MLNTAEIFDPVTETFTPVTNTLTSPRAAHTATLLPDGTVLLLGGEDATAVLATAEIFDPATETFASVSTGLGTARKNHTATLLPFGQVLVTGGHDGAAILATTELYSQVAGDTTAPTVSQVLPADAATGVEPNQIVGLRFTEPVDVTTLTSANVTLTNGGTVTGIVSPAEEGLMVFVVPNAPLTSGTPYTLSLSSAITDTAGNPLPAFTSTFTTAAEPVITDFSPQSGPEGTEVTITGQNFDPVASRNEVKFNGVVASVTSATDTTIVTTVPTGATTGPITVTTAGGTATSATDFTVATGPAITNVAPLSGPFGTAVTITGSGFDPVPSNNQVAFNGAPAIITSATTTTITTTVPLDATSGFVTVTTPQDTATSPQPFDVTFEQDFTLAALPAQVTVPSAGQAAFALTLAGTGGFANLVTLQVTGVPTGATAVFSAPTLTTGQSAFLTLSTNGTTADGTYPLTVTGTGLLGNTQTVRSVPVNVQVLGAGVTTLAGQVLDEEDNPVKGALVTLGSLQVSTDDGGNFLMQNPPVGADQQLFIDGGPASTPEHSLPIIPYKVTVVAGQANTLGFTPYLHFQKTTGLVDISNSSVERIVTDPDIPGFEMRIPAGVTITGWDGQLNTEVSVRRVPIDRTPLPTFPEDRFSPVLYMYYFGKPGGGTPSEPIPVTLPNESELPPGTQVELWYYDEAPDGSRPNEWAQYGTATVSADGSQIVPDIDPATGKPFGQPRFCCGANRWGILGTILGALGLGPGKDKRSGGDPVDLATGLFTLDNADLVLSGRMPVTFTRHHRSSGTTGGPFGVGTSHSFNPLLLIESDARTLLTARGTRYLFSRQPDGTFRNQRDPEFLGAVVTETGTTHTLRFKDGTTWTFGVPFGGAAFLLSQADRNGNTITLTRDGARRVTMITDASGRQITLTYDAEGRITKIQDPIGREVQYHYDAEGRLATVTDPAFGITRYTYDDFGRMLTITDPRGITFLTNEFDSAGRVMRQTLADGGIWKFAYTETAGAITSTTVTDPRGNTNTTRFNGQTYVLEDIDGLACIIHE